MGNLRRGIAAGAALIIGLAVAPGAHAQGTRSCSASQLLVTAPTCTVTVSASECSRGLGCSVYARVLASTSTLPVVGGVAKGTVTMNGWTNYPISGAGVGVEETSKTASCGPALSFCSAETPKYPADRRLGVR